MTKKTFIKESEVLIELLKDTAYQMTVGLSGNKASAQRARVALVNLEKAGKVFRKESLEYISKVKKSKLLNKKKG